MDRRNAVLKRVLDVTASGIGLIALAPLMGGIAALVVSKHGWPPLFSQQRPGLHGQLFTLRKFRTMTNDRDADGILLADAERLTSFGKWLRASSLDELPELFNVLRGEMSLVGPRPLLSQYLSRYTTEQSRRHEVKPGITGWAQIHGRNALSWEEKFALDIWYVDNASFLIDLRILALTGWSVLTRKGISAPGSATMPIFMGTKEPE